MATDEPISVTHSGAFVGGIPAVFATQSGKNRQATSLFRGCNFARLQQQSIGTALPYHTECRRKHVALYCLTNGVEEHGRQCGDAGFVDGPAILRVASVA